ncbi:MaoC family dehydratase N-terminal domain-containing protein [Egicoccus sp. AB-alg2]|uniref:FAS1-like dehydratase domain-containing protein n=1 Tax=Egicoccus sp. AB-alg2 TaxID=3242693 RepID=UPI00359DEE07
MREPMALNPDKVGTSYPPYTYEVSREKIREYAMALGERDPRYYSDGDDCVAPPTFAAAFTVTKGGQAAFADPDLGAHWTLVHGSQTYQFGSRPIRPGDVLSCTPRIADIAVRGSNELMTIEVDCRFADDDTRAVLSKAVIVFLGSAPAADTRDDTAPATAADDDAARAAEEGAA